MNDRRTAILRASATAIAQNGIRALRVTDVAEQAGVSAGLLYYHFTDRIGLLQAALTHINDCAREYREEDSETIDSAAERLARALLGEIQDRDDVVENSRAWNELRASAVFDAALREPVARTTADWVAQIADAITEAQQSGEVSAAVDPHQAATTLTALVEGISGRWLCGELATTAAHTLLRDALRSLVPHVTTRNP